MTERAGTPVVEATRPGGRVAARRVGWARGVGQAKAAASTSA